MDSAIAYSEILNYNFYQIMLKTIVTQSDDKTQHRKCLRVRALFRIYLLELFRNDNVFDA